ncbi:cyclase family protein [Conexibacter woesei]|uniref:Cyclase family protein n=1 Tax=Conexibacter woesei (strain DSM 14684 / CCUG 47730 / CIP 108061 / JCM 11494 / NBRC 100937 / ID131577) TaxID=469383 RepID=D3FC42_CONWI|nr:cyclase family protein [Conexibacter woesei]ADB53337.1 cyclase family protein [Conexibacter woesei DSM 14684]
MSATTIAALIDALGDASVQVVDLTQPLSERTPVIQLPEPFANTPPLRRRELSRYDDRGPMWAWSVLEIGEHTGTHFDAPIHWISGRDGEDVASVPPSKLVGPAVVVDKTAEVQRDPSYLLTVADLQHHEREHGRIPDGAWLLFRTGWERHAHDAEAFLNVGENGPVTPGPDAAATRWLAEERAVAGFGVETVGTDAGAAGGFDPPFPAHNHLLGAGVYGLTQLANLGELPVTGALLVVAPLRLVDGTGSPARVLALVPA